MPPGLRTGGRAGGLGRSRTRNEERCPRACVPVSEAGRPPLASACARECVWVFLGRVTGGIVSLQKMGKSSRRVPTNGTLLEAASPRMIKLRRSHGGGPILQAGVLIGRGHSDTDGHRPCANTERRLQGKDCLRPPEARGAEETPPHGLRWSEGSAPSTPSSQTSASGTGSPHPLQLETAPVPGSLLRPP